ncbi:hypothetical protein BDV12DRAFT_185457 [Aspergillus spectabilis]
MPRSTRTTGGRHSEPSREYDTQSLTASVTEYPIENGRTYHKYHEGSYVYPNDEREMDRLDMQHHMCKLLTGGRLFFAPLINPRKILDIGTGSGIWPIELASIFPHAQITGTDLSPCQPTEVPENVHFIVDDITDDEWLWNHNSLDYIRIGHLSGALPSYKDLLRKTLSHLKPGAWAEIHEFDTMVKCDDGTMPPLDDSMFSTYQFQDWCDLQIQSGHTTDPPRQFRVAHRLARGMRELGFVDVQERIFKAPVNPWSSDPHLRTIGQWNETNILEALSGWSYKPLKALGWSKPEIEVFLVNVRRSVQDRRVHAYFNFHARCVYRHATIPSATPLTEYLWVSEDLVASTLRRFVNNQRRHGSRVPGPLEARRRLDKRRNTAMASVIGAGPMDDVACFLGLNGTEHLKQNNDREIGLGYRCYPSCLPPTPVPFDDENPDTLDWPDVQISTKKVTRDQLENRIRDFRTTSDLEDAVRELKIDLRQEPRYSRLLFDHLRSGVDQGVVTIDELISFLDNPHLNTHGAGNYLEAVTHCISGSSWSEVESSYVLKGLLRGLKLGNIHSEELHATIRALAESERNIPVENRDRQHPPWIFRAMWDSIGSCDVYGHQDLDKPLLDTWLGFLLERGTPRDFTLARDILLATNHDVVDRGKWLPKFMTRLLHRWLETAERTRGGNIVRFLYFFDPDLITNSIIDVTRSLFASQETHLLDAWKALLPRIGKYNKKRVASSLVSSRILTQSHEPSPRLSDGSTITPTRRVMHRVIECLWILHAMRSDKTVCKNYARHTDPLYEPTKVLYRYYDALRDDPNKDLWDSFTKSIPSESHLFNMRAIVKDLRTQKITRFTRRLGRFDRKGLSLSEMFLDRRAYYWIFRDAFFQSIAETIQDADFTSSEFLEDALHIARNGDKPSVMNLIRLFRAHVPFKIALAFSRPTLDPIDPDPVGHGRAPSAINYPNPQAALAAVHSVAIAISCSENLTCREAFEYIQWFYRWLLRHGAPLQPPLVRAMYHAGVVRMRREGRAVGIEQYQYIMGIVAQGEDPEIVAALRKENAHLEGFPTRRELEAIQERHAQLDAEFDPFADL